MPQRRLKRNELSSGEIRHLLTTTRHPVGLADTIAKERGPKAASKLLLIAEQQTKAPWLKAHTNYWPRVGGAAFHTSNYFERAGQHKEGAALLSTFGQHVVAARLLEKGGHTELAAKAHEKAARVWLKERKYYQAAHAFEKAGKLLDAMTAYKRDAANAKNPIDQEESLNEAARLAKVTKSRWQRK
ncbi:MAG: hypothetical protein V1722_00320 [Candidatus Micrarchaeota archaeon]